MIKLTYRALIMALTSGAYKRFLAIRKPVPVSHKNRKVPAAAQSEIKVFGELRDAIVAAHGGALNKDQTDYDWPADERERGTKAVEELLEQVVELPGERIRVTDLLDGGLCEGDYDLLEPFLEATP